MLNTSVLLFVVSSLAAAGLAVAPQAATAPMRNARFLALTIGLGWVLCPAVAFVLVHLMPVPAPYETGLVLLSLAPGAPFAPAMGRLAHADAAYTATFMAIAAATTVVLMPVGVALLLPGAEADPRVIAGPLLWFVLAPLLTGMMIRGRWPDAARRIAVPLDAIARITTAAMLVLMVAVYGRAVLEAVGSFAILTLLIFLVAVTVVADLAGAGLPLTQRGALTIGIGTRNLGAALAPAAMIDPDRRVIVLIVIAAPLTLAVAAVAARALARRQLQQRDHHVASLPK